MCLWVFGYSNALIRCTYVNRKCFSYFYGSLLLNSNHWTYLGSAFESSSINRSVHRVEKIWARHHAFVINTSSSSSWGHARYRYDTCLLIPRPWRLDCPTKSSTKTMPDSWWRMCHGQHFPFLSLSYTSDFNILVCVYSPHRQRKKHKTTKVWCNWCFCCCTCPFDLHSDRRLWRSMLQPSYWNLSDYLSVESTSQLNYCGQLPLWIYVGLHARSSSRRSSRWNRFQISWQICHKIWRWKRHIQLT